jgi:hypothetical protein
VSIETILYEFITRLEVETGIRNPVTKIGFDRRVFDHIVYTLAQKDKYSIGMHTIADGGLKVMGIEIVARQPEKF